MLNSHFPFFLLLFLPVLILEFGMIAAQYSSGVGLNSIWSFNNYLGSNSYSTVASTVNIKLAVGLFGFVFLISLISGLLMTGIQFVGIDLLRNETTFEQPVTKSFTIFNNGEYFIGTLMISIITGILTFLWSFLLIIPGIIKGYAYSQAIFIYRDALDKGEKIGYFEAIDRSRQLMNGHKVDLFVLGLSYIGWFLLSSLTLNLLDLWVIPYYNLAIANFYVKIHDDQAKHLPPFFLTQINQKSRMIPRRTIQNKAKNDCLPAPYVRRRQSFLALAVI
ncbi:hypothetical protein JCM14108_998 [Lentilactobacillus farraginis DSM 18382 = JCM 14108]|uniref:Integral membrane protein n=1 Tax=Lentilactobacillus farraginis DSM 18382 = JCM 14108 TaxID=1423743 RepID=X0PGH2_9LACO|nr:hypothetical protein JCM14108_998 [Lentilactobacillus farraginis DSM 18382 = JCM 14108]